MVDKEQMGVTSWHLRGREMWIECQTGQLPMRSIRTSAWGLPGGSVVENPPANAGDGGSIPDQGRPHMPQSNQAHGP